MPEARQTLVVSLDSPETELIGQALSSKQRIKLLALVTKQAMNVNEIANALGLRHPTVSVHIKALEEAGLITSGRFSTGKGSEKRCWATYQRLSIDSVGDQPIAEEHTREISMPIGLFTNIHAEPNCGLSSETSIIGTQDTTQSFLLPERVGAQIMWFTHGWVEYTFPCELSPMNELTAIEFSAEICSEVKDYNNDYPSDITLWINGIEVGTWTSPGDLGGRRGRLTPHWWPKQYTQFGMLSTWRIDASGCHVNGLKVLDTTLADLDVQPGQRLPLRIGVKPDAVHPGGLNLFGSRFGDYPQDLILRYHYLLKHSA